MRIRGGRNLTIMKKYEKPNMVNLGDLKLAKGYCQSGSTAGDGFCDNGGLASGGSCQTGGRANGPCSVGSDAIQVCTAGATYVFRPGY